MYLYMCAQMCTAKQGFGICAAKGAPFSSDIRNGNQIETIFLSVYDFPPIRVASNLTTFLLNTPRVWTFLA